MEVSFDHAVNVHSLAGARAALEAVLPVPRPQRVLDVGCGVGYWLKAALDLGVPAVFGMDGVAVPSERLMIPENCFRRQNLTEPWRLGQRFDWVMCLEVGEHLPSEHAPALIEALAASGESVLFSAAVPGQPGQDHVNCQWPAFWQNLFNKNGFVCDDSIRWKIWSDERIEPWYRQNLFVALRNPVLAGHEPRIRAVIHPGMLQHLAARQSALALKQVRAGTMGLRWYFRTCFRGFVSSLWRSALHQEVQSCRHEVEEV